jgi:elongation factor G
MSRLRTFGIVAHIDAGKTTLTERILFDTGAQSWLGSVDDGTAATDWMPAERSRGISITAAAIRVQWGGQALQVVDTPGHVDFVAEVERCLRVIDAVVVVVDGVRGVESQTRAVWRQAVAAGLPRLVFINKLDRTGADYAAVVAEVAEQLECVPVPLVVPLLSGAGAFAGLGDAITGAVQWFDGRPDEDLVPALQSRLLAAHERAVEVAADHDDAVLRDVLEGRRVEPARLQKALRAAFLAGAIVPVLGGSALYNRGVDWLLDAVVVLLPTVAELPRRGIWAVPQAGNRAAPVCGFVFKVQHLDRVWNFVRVLRGRLEAGARLVRGRQPQHDVAVEELWLARADRHEVLSEAGPGEIVVVPGEFGWRTGDTVCAVGAPVTLPQVRFPAPVLAVTFEPERAGSAAALFAAVRELAADDPTLRAERDADRIVVRGMGELHLEIVGDLVRARTGLGFRVSRPRVDRRETVDALAAARSRSVRTSPAPSIRRAAPSWSCRTPIRSRRALSTPSAPRLPPPRRRRSISSSRAAHAPGPWSAVRSGSSRSAAGTRTPRSCSRRPRARSRRRSARPGSSCSSPGSTSRSRRRPTRRPRCSPTSGRAVPKSSASLRGVWGRGSPAARPSPACWATSRSCAP